MYSFLDTFSICHGLSVQDILLLGGGSARPTSRIVAPLFVLNVTGRLTNFFLMLRFICQSLSDGKTNVLALASSSELKYCIPNATVPVLGVGVAAP